MNKRFICILAIVSILISAFPAGSAFADGGGHAAVDGIGIKAGDYILFGKYNNKPILWQCAYKDENGKLMVSDKSICSKAFDSVGMLKGSHVHRYEHDRLLNVSNYWGDSNIRSWLNSKAPAGEVNWLCGNPPESYGNEKGFLADGNFTQEERALIKTVKQRSILDGSDVRLAAVSGGNRAIRGYSHGYFSLACDAQNIVENSYDDIYYEYVTDKMFLLDIKQYVKMPNKYADGSYYWLRTPLGECYQYSGRGDTYHRGIRVFRATPDYSESYAYVEAVGAGLPCGVRPAFYLNENAAVIRSGSGTADEPYVLDTWLSGDELVDDFDPAAGYYKHPAISVFVNGVEVKFEQEPYNIGIIIAPMRPMLEALGARVEWYGDTETIMVYDKGNTYELHHSDPYIIKNGENILIKKDHPHVVGDMTYIAVDLLSQCFDAEVEWNYDEQTVYITR